MKTKQTQPQSPVEFTTVRIRTSTKQALESHLICYQSQVGRRVTFAEYMDKLAKAAAKLKLD